MRKTNQEITKPVCYLKIRRKVGEEETAERQCLQEAGIGAELLRADVRLQCGGTVPARARGVQGISVSKKYSVNIV